MPIKYRNYLLLLLPLQLVVVVVVVVVVVMVEIRGFPATTPTVKTLRAEVLVHLQGMQ